VRERETRRGGEFGGDQEPESEVPLKLLSKEAEEKFRFV